MEYSPNFVCLFESITCKLVQQGFMATVHHAEPPVDYGPWYSPKSSCLHNVATVRLLSFPSIRC